MNQILCIFCIFTHGYVDNIVIFSKMLNEHVNHLHQIFQLFQELDISLEFKKSFLDYFIITLLDQWVDALNLITVSKKIQAIADLQFPLTLRALKIYLDLTGWLHFYISYYAQITAPLQICKTALAKTSLVFKENVWKQHSQQITVNRSTSEELKVFEILQNLFKVSIFLAHFNSEQQLYINVNAFKQYDFSAIIYHVQDDSDLNLISVDAKVMKFPCHKIQPILFLSKLLTSVKRNYWFIKMEIASLIWVVCKTRHLIKSASDSIIVFTDHSATMLIVCQTQLTMTVSMNKLNLWLVWVSQYLSQFNLDV